MPVNTHADLHERALTLTLSNGLCLVDPSRSVASSERSVHEVCGQINYMCV